MCDVPQPSSRRAFGSRDRATASAQLVAVRRGRLIAAAIGAALLAVWAAGATWCLLASDTLSAGLLARQSAIQYAYEDRIGDLRTRLDRVSTQKLVEQESLNARLHELAARQLKIQARQVVVNRLAAQAGATAVGAGSAAADDLSAADDLAPVMTLAPRPAKPLPVPDLLDLRRGGESCRAKPRSAGARAAGPALAARPLDQARRGGAAALDRGAAAALGRPRLGLAHGNRGDGPRAGAARAARGARRRRRRPLRAAALRLGGGRLRARRRAGAEQPHAAHAPSAGERRPAACPPDERRGRSHERLRHAHRSLHPRTGDAHRARLQG